MTPETETEAAALLLATARPAPGPLPARRPDWEAAITMALHHGTAGQLCRHVLGPSGTILPENLQDAMRAYLDSRAQRQRVALAELLELLDNLNGAGITALPLKGPALAARAYADPLLRPCLDLDILIHERDIDRTLAVLAKLGFVSQYPSLRPEHRAAYHRYNGHDCLIAPGRAMPVEPHWALAPRVLAVLLDTDPMFERARPVELAGRMVSTLAPEDMLLIAVLHGSKEEWARLIWIADVAALLALPGLDTAAVLARATAAGIRRMLLVGFALAAELLDAPRDPCLAAALAADPKAGRLAAWAAARLWEQRQAPSVFVLSPFRWYVRERRGDRAHYAAAVLLTARVKHFQALHLPGPLRYLYPAVRVGHDFLAHPLWRAIGGRRA